MRKMIASLMLASSIIAHPAIAKDVLSIKGEWTPTETRLARDETMKRLRTIEAQVDRALAKGASEEVSDRLYWQTSAITRAWANQRTLSDKPCMIAGNELVGGIETITTKPATWSKGDYVKALARCRSSTY
ncbi:hypothetical protein B7R77_02980 [Ralstonia solanacearum K60]|uniref:Uncharacterized protein n=1 Tax=Ralstonia solanacearum K60 TaxID=1091042 RepID=A0AAP8D345_RALSL|nr:hypothetical protein [Ralstonia solanacearum]OYQ12319.1 hypothetical protein B7R77_02980 [Ralstonia solanacearum K60]CCF96518.1 hypothetical protein RSK60_1520037 [Ralstonia solanacearum K60]